MEEIHLTDCSLLNVINNKVNFSGEMKLHLQKQVLKFGFMVKTHEEALGSPQ